MTRPSTRASGFTLIELAIVLFIVSLLIGGMLIPLSAQTEIRGHQETDKALATIREALIGFAAINGRLPCPAVASIPSGTTVSGLQAGMEATTPAGANGPCACATSANSGIAGIVGAGAVACSVASADSVGGVLPWATLGLQESDAWEHRYTYRVSTQFARLATGQTDFGACTPATRSRTRRSPCARWALSPYPRRPAAAQPSQAMSRWSLFRTGRTASVRHRRPALSPSPPRLPTKSKTQTTMWRL